MRRASGLWLGIVGGLLAVLLGLLVVVVLRPVSPDSSAIGQGSSVPVLDSKSSAGASSPSASVSDDWRSWPVWEVMPPAEMLPQLYGGDPLKGGEPRDDWRLPKTLQGWALNDRDYSLPGFDDYSTGVVYEDASRDPKRVLSLDTQSLELPDAFNRHLRAWEDVHHVGRFTCGTAKTGKNPECVAYAEDTVIVLWPILGRFTEQEVVDAMDELVDHLLATR